MFEGRRTARLGDVDPAGRMRLDALVRFLQDLSAEDTADVALPDAESWVVRRTAVRVERAPRYLERLELATWCAGTGSHWAERRISLTGARGASVEAATLWVHLDPASGRPRRLPESFLATYGEAAGGRTVAARLRHPKPPEDGDGAPWALRRTDLDLLGHVNNAACWEAVEEVRGHHPELLGPVVAEVEHHRSLEGHEAVAVRTADLDGTCAVWLVGDGSLAVSALLRPA